MKVHPARISRPLLSSPSLKKSDGFDAVIAAFRHDGKVTYKDGTGFGSNALQVNGKMFALVSSKGQFVAKLSAMRVTELVHARIGNHFDAGRGKNM